MTTPLDTIKEAILGVPYDATKKPSRQGTVKAFAEMQVQLEGAQAGALVKDTLAALTALTSVSEASIMAWVTNDATQANNGIYENTGTDVAPAWTRRLDIPQFVISGVNVGAGTADAIQATTDLPIPVQDGRTLIMLPIVVDNTGPATVAFNGGDVLPILSIASDPLVAGNLLDGMFVSGFINDGNFTLTTDVNSAAAAAISAASAAAAVISAAAALVSETNAAVSAAAALVSETNAAASADASLAAAVVSNLTGLDLAAGAGLGVYVNEAGDALEFVDVVTFYKGANIVSASDLAIGENDTYVHVSGTNTINTIEDVADAQPLGAFLTLRFGDTLQLIHSGSLILKNGQNITTSINDMCTFVKHLSGVWRLVSYERYIEEPVKTGTFVAVLNSVSGNIVTPLPTVNCNYVKNHNIVTLHVEDDVIGELLANDTLVLSSLPLEIEPSFGTHIWMPCAISDGGLYGFGYAEISASHSTQIRFQSALNPSQQQFSLGTGVGVRECILTYKI